MIAMLTKEAFLVDSYYLSELWSSRSWSSIPDGLRDVLTSCQSRPSTSQE